MKVIVFITDFSGVDRIIDHRRGDPSCRALLRYSQAMGAGKNAAYAIPEELTGVDLDHIPASPSSSSPVAK